MKILVLSNFYPPYHIGGYELGCQDIVNRLRGKGETVWVLTSNLGEHSDTNSNDIHRSLILSDTAHSQTASTMSFSKRLEREVTNRSRFKELCGVFRPDLLYVFNLSRISLSLIQLAQELLIPVCYYVSDPWMTNIKQKDWWLGLWSRHYRNPVKAVVSQFGKPLARSMGLPVELADWRLDQTQFASQYLKSLTLNSGLNVEEGRVIPWGVDTANYHARTAFVTNIKRFVYVGQLVPHKGVHTAIEAFGKLSNLLQHSDLMLTIVGDSADVNYKNYLEEIVHAFQIESRVAFKGFVPREEIPSVLAEHDALVFPSIWDEPFSLSLLEGLASGLAIIATSTGGTKEILKDNVNALIFAKDDSDHCAHLMKILVENPPVAEDLAINARTTIEASFRIEQMVERIQKDLRLIVDKDRARSSRRLILENRNLA